MKTGMTAEEQAFALELGAWIYASRKARKLSQMTLAEACRCHHNTVCRWERGQTMPNLVEYRRLKSFFKSGKSVAEFQSAGPAAVDAESAA
jgi:ribosome-binding protein aMBF1 (putative translation factor)